MQAWYHCENVYPFVPQEVLAPAESVCAPEISADLFEECLDEHLLCDELGVNVVSIEHHSGINSLYGASPMILGILARQTKKVRILSLGTLITIRPDPVRIAEEYATADVISRGRVEIGFVKSGDSEMVSGSATPVGYVERFWEAIDLIQKTLTSHDGPFSWEGKHYTHRHVNIWPPVYQRPHPPMWAATGDPETSAELGRRGYVNALVLRGPEASKRASDAYRQARQDAGLPAPGTDRFAYAALCYVGDTDEEGVAVGSKLLWFLNTSLKQGPQMSKFLPGRNPPHLAPDQRARPPGRPADRHHRRAGDRPRHPMRRQPGHGVSADHGDPREGRWLRALDLYRPLRLPDAGRAGKGHPADGEGGVAAPARRHDDASCAGRSTRRRAITPRRRTTMSDATTAWIDPELVAAGKLLQEKGLVAPDRTVASLAEVRAATDRIGAFLGEGSVPLQSERDLSLPGPHGQVPCRLYLPDGIERPPLIIYAHGGGFMQGSLPSWDAMLRELVRQSGVGALSVDYQLSPEVKFPVAFDEMVAMTRLAAREGAGFGIDPNRLAVGGDSAGANLALAAALAMRDAGETALRFQLLIYGCFSTDLNSPSWQHFGQGAGLSQASMRWAWQTYLEKPEHWQDWRAAPILADLTGLPSASLIVG